MRTQKEFNPELNHDMLVEKMQQKLAYNPANDYSAWKQQIKDKLYELTGLDDIAKNACPLNVQIEWEEQKEGYKMIRFTFESEVGETVPCYLLVPDLGKEKYPVAITLQGHSSGFHNSIGEPKPDSADGAEYALGRGKFAVQAVQNGYIALAIEQRGMGERKPVSGNRHKGVNCQYAGKLAFMMGRTLLGERMWDVSKAIDVITEYFPVCDTDKILITGNSGGGTMSWYAACYDERIKLSVPSCAFCPYKESILSIAHCVCNYIPFAYKWFEMHDLACLIAPRNLVLITGEKDPIFPLHGVKRGFETVKSIYEANGVADKCRLVVTPREHWWCEEIVWNAINEETKKMGW